MAASTKLAKQTQKTAGIGNGLRTATVASVTQQGVMLNINGSIVGPFACTAAMLPVVGSTVSVFRQDSTWIILGHANPVPPQVIRGTYTTVATLTFQPSGFINYSPFYPPGTLLVGHVNLTSGAASQGWVPRFIPQDETRFQLFFTAPATVTPGVVLNYNVIVFPVA